MSKSDNVEFEQIHRRQRNDFRDNILTWDTNSNNVRVALYIASRLNHFLNYGLAWPSVTTMAKKLHLNVHTIVRATQWLESEGILKVTKATVAEMKPSYAHLPNFKEVRWPHDTHPRNWYQPVWTHPAWLAVMTASIPSRTCDARVSEVEKKVDMAPASVNKQSLRKRQSDHCSRGNRAIAEEAMESGDVNPCPNPGAAGQGSNDRVKKLEQQDEVPTSGKDAIPTAAVAVITRLLKQVQKNLGLEVPYAVRDHGEKHWVRYASVFYREALPHFMKCRNPVSYLETVIMDNAFGGIDNLNWYSLLSGKYLNRLIGRLKDHSGGRLERTTLEDIQAYFAEEDRQDKADREAARSSRIAQPE
jgi:hypothetical protein